MEVNKNCPEGCQCALCKRRRKVLGNVNSNSRSDINYGFARLLSRPSVFVEPEAVGRAKASEARAALVDLFNAMTKNVSLAKERGFFFGLGEERRAAAVAEESVPFDEIMRLYGIVYDALGDAIPNRGVKFTEGEGRSGDTKIQEG